MSDRSSVQAIHTQFVERYMKTAPFAADRALGDEISLQASPVIESLAIGLSSERASDLSAPEYREGFALVGLLGRRAGTLTATPTAGVALIDSLVAALRGADFNVTPSGEAALRGAFFEGFVAGREDGLLERAQKAASLAQPVVEFAPRCLGLFLRGRHEPDALTEASERFSRELLRTNAMGCLVDLVGLEEPTPDRAGIVFAIDETARMLGARSVFIVEDVWRSAAVQARVPTELLRMVPTFAAGLDLALRDASYAVKKKGRFF